MRSGTIAFLVGITTFHQLATIPGAAWGWLLLVVTGCLLVLSRWCTHFLIPFAACAGFGYAFCYASLIAPTPLPREFEGVDVVVEGVIASLPDRQERRLRFEFLPDALLLSDGREQPLGNIRLTWYGKALPTLTVGERWRLTVRLKRAHGMSNPGGFDYERWLYQRGIRTTGYVRPQGKNLLLASRLSDMPLQRLRQELREILEKRLAGEEARGVITALAIGDRGALSDEQWRILTESGTNHLMAISGLHVGMVAGLFYLLGGWLWRLRANNLLIMPAPGVGALSAIFGALIYAALAGFSIPTQRALIMVTVAMGAVLFRRHTLPNRVLALALLLVVLLDPLAVLSAGFWLSFLAVATILYGMTGRLRQGRVITQWGRIQLLVSLGLLPLLILYFNQAAVAAPLANLIAVPWMGMIVVPLTLLGTLLAVVMPDIGTLLLILAARLAELLLVLLGYMLELLPPLAMASPPPWAWLPAIIGLLWLLAPKGWPARWLGLLLLLPLFHSDHLLPQGAFRFTLFDVGQGLAVVVETREHILIYDTGPRFESGFDTGHAVIVPWLKHMGVPAVDTLVVSHGDNDHIGGARSLVEQIPVKRVLTSVPGKMAWIPHESCHVGERWNWDGIRFELLHPVPLEESGHHPRGNNGSCVLKISGESGSVLLPGDIEAQAEQELLARAQQQLTATVLLAPHHGSKTSSSKPFVETVQPRWVLFPVGYRNRYGFPHEGVVKRYLEVGATTLDSATSGAITFTFDPQYREPLIGRYRETARRYWQSD
jgi:competence protein ComEC